jgi:hypothetical protein
VLQQRPPAALAVDTAGRLVLVAIDGVERLLLGVTLAEAAEIFSGGATGKSSCVAFASSLARSKRRWTLAS